ncbi:MAG: hypothetical protein LBT36_01775 [Oscillospiraceae bacterium]|jgi:flagellar hook-associated protein 3 FlgL|nr:hypothetical protein [Oscillospiraceae bacterium]
MRITNLMILNKYVNNLNTNLGKVDGLSLQLETGRKYAHISDDPVSVIYAQQARYKLARLADYQQNVQLTQTWATEAETGTMELQDLIKQAYYECVGASQDAKTETDFQNAAMSIGQLREQILSALNSTFGDKFVFGGYNTTGYPDTGPSGRGVTPPFGVDAVTGHLTYNGIDLLDRDYTLAASGTLDSAGLVTLTAPTDEDVLRAALNSGASLTVKFEVGSGLSGMKDALKVTVGGQSLYINADTDLSVPIDFPELGVSVDLSSYAGSFSWLGDGADHSADAAALAAVGALGTDNRVEYTSAPAAALQPIFDRLQGEKLTFDVGLGIPMQATINGIDLAIFDKNGDNLFNIVSELYDALQNGGPAEAIAAYIPRLQAAQNHVLTKVAELGGRQTRLEMLENRYSLDNINYTQLLSDAEDADVAELAMNYQMALTVYQASLQTGAYIIQPTLLDYLG